MYVSHIYKIIVKPAQSCPTLCDPMSFSPPGFSVLGVLQAGTLEWVASPSSRASAETKDQTWVSCIARRTLYCLSQQGSPKITIMLFLYLVLWESPSTVSFNFKFTLHSSGEWDQCKVFLMMLLFSTDYGLFILFKSAMQKSAMTYHSQRWDSINIIYIFYIIYI